MRALGLCVLAAAAAAQTPPAPQPSARALVYGVLIERDAGVAGGQFAVRLPANEVLRYRFDAKTYVVRNDALIDMARLRPGEKVEVLSDAVPGSPLRYARDVHVVGETPAEARTEALSDPRPAAPLPGLAARHQTYPFDETFLFTGDLTFSGVVARITANRLVLHTRAGEQALQVRTDTRFLDDGELVAAADLKPNTRVFIKAGKGIYGELEAYQIIWGRILAPQ